MELLDNPNLSNDHKKKQKLYLENKIDVTAFVTWFVDNYPSSVKTMKENPDYQYKFK